MRPREHPESPAGGAGPGKGAGQGTWRVEVTGAGSVSRAGVPSCAECQEGDRRVFLGPLGRIPGRGRDPPIQAPAGRKQTWGAQTSARSVGPRVLAPRPAARHYLHEDPEKQGSDPDLNGQFSHGVAGAAPAAAAGALGGSRSLAGAGSPDPGRRGRRAPGRGRGREAGAGRGGRAAGRTQHKSPAQGSGVRGRSADRPRRSQPRGPCAEREGAWGTPGSPAPGTASASWARRALRSRPGEGKPGEARTPPPPLRAPRLPRQWAAPGLGARAARSLGLCLRPLCVSSLVLDSRCSRGSGSLAHALTWAGSSGAL